MTEEMDLENGPLPNPGYIKIFRSLMDKGYYGESDYVSLWVHLLMKATYKPREYLFNNKIEHLKPGEFIAGRKSLARETGIQESKIERILKCFESEQQIEQHSTNKFRVISITNWDKYQVNEQQNKQPVNSKRTTSEQHVNTNKKEKKDNKEKNNIKSSVYTLPDEETIRESSIPKIKTLIKEISDELYYSKIWPDAPKYKNTMLKRSKNPRAVLYTLIRVYLKHPDIDTIWGYCQQILKIEDGNFNERDGQKNS